MQQAQQFAKMAGFGHNLKLVLYLQSQCLAESLGFLNPPLLQAAKRCGEIRSAPFATTVRRITSASCARRFADFAQQADLLNPKNGSQLPSRDFANPPNR